MADVAEIAAGLKKCPAQMRLILSSEWNVLRAWETGRQYENFWPAERRLLEVLATKGLLIFEHGHLPSYHRWKLTPLGLAVRLHLLEQ